MQKSKILLFAILLLLSSCISQFIPQTAEDKQILVVEGLITNQYEGNTIKLSRSLPLGGISSAKPLSGCNVTVSDNTGRVEEFYEHTAGTYTPSPDFIGEVGKTYILHIKSNSVTGSINYESLPVEMKPVPEVDSVFYEKETISPSSNTSAGEQGCQVYLNTHDPGNSCKFYRWEFSETWEFILPYAVPNKVCWISSSSDVINIKNTSVLAENRINRYPLTFISNKSDRVKVKYSILVKQYSMTEDEFTYWDKLQNLSQQVGGLYDIIPSAVPSNVFSKVDPAEKVLGYFSVSATSSKRIFIKDHFAGLIDLYKDCPQDTLDYSAPIPNLNNTVWVIVDHPIPPPSYRVITYTRGCADCTARGTSTPPDFWSEGN